MNKTELEIVKRLDSLEGFLSRTHALVQGHIESTEDRDTKIDEFLDYLKLNKASLDELIESQKWVVKTGKILAILGGVMLFFWTFLKEFITKR